MKPYVKKKFDLMKNKPVLDYDTLNYVWDIIWRFNYLNEQKNEQERGAYGEQQRILNYIQTLANE